MSGQKRWLGKNAERKRSVRYVLFIRCGSVIMWRTVEGTDHIARMRKMANEYKF